MKPTPNLNRPAYTNRPSMRPHSLSRKIKTSQAYATTKRPSKVTLPPMPEELRK